MKWMTLFVLLLMPLLSRAGDGFDSMMDSFDSGTLSGREHFRQNVIRVLNSEELDPPELRMLRAALAQVNRIEPTVLYRRIENELTRLTKVFEAAPQPRALQWIRFCKRNFPAWTAPLIHTEILKLPVRIESESFRSIPTNTRDLAFVKWPAPAPAGRIQTETPSENRHYNRDWPLK